MVLVAALVVGAATMLRIEPTATDIVLDKYQAVEAWGGDPYVTQAEIVAKHGLGSYGHPAPSPRSPAAILVQSLTIPLNDEALRWLAMVASVAATAATFWVSGRIGRVDQRVMAAGFLAYVLWRFGRLVWWNVTDVTTPLLAAGWWQIRRRSRLAGVLFGVATAVKLWPAVVIAMLIARRDSRKAGLWAILSTGMLTVAGLMIPSVSAGGTVEVMQSAAAMWGSELTLIAVLSAAFAFVFGWSRSVDWAIGGAIFAGLMLSPIVWLDYWLAMLPAVAMLVRLAHPNHLGWLTERWAADRATATPRRSIGPT